jgi:tartrate dehydratase alpha subunit/fumarate hydratase class I-like protein
LVPTAVRDGVSSWVADGVRVPDADPCIVGVGVGGTLSDAVTMSVAVWAIVFDGDGPVEAVCGVLSEG